MSIEDKIKELPPKTREEFGERLLNVLYSRLWCLRNGIDYTNPDVSKAKEVLFKKEYEQYLPVTG